MCRFCPLVTRSADYPDRARYGRKTYFVPWTEEVSVYLKADRCRCGECEFRQIVVPHHLLAVWPNRTLRPFILTPSEQLGHRSRSTRHRHVTQSHQVQPEIERRLRVGI